MKPFHHKRETKYEMVDLDYASRKVFSKDKAIAFTAHDGVAGLIIDPHFHNWYEFTYATYGKQEITIGMVTYVLEKGDFLMIPPGYMHGSRMLEDTGKITMLVEERYIEKLVPIEKMQKVVCNSTQITDQDQFGKAEELIALFLKMADMIKRDSWEDRLEMEGTFLLFLSLLLRNFSDPSAQSDLSAPTRKHQMLTSVTNLIFKNYGMPLKLKDVARQHHVSGQYIEKIFQEEKGMSYKAFLTEVRLNHAVYELIHTDKSITEILYDAGFGSSKSFIYYFRERFHMTPTQFRKEHRQS